jgi:hypothetical protein
MRVLCGVLAFLTASVAMPVAANGWRQGFVPAQMQRHQDRFQRQPQRDVRNPPQQQDRGPRDGRMTEQERRDLHRDLDRANRELYKGRR